MTEAINLQKKRVLQLGVSARIVDLEEILRDIAASYYHHVEIVGTVDGVVSEHVKVILQKADHHGIEIVDNTPSGSLLKPCMHWELRLIIPRTA